MHTTARVLGQNGAQQLFLALGQSLHLPAHPLTPWQRDAQARFKPQRKAKPAAPLGTRPIARSVRGSLLRVCE